MKAKILNPAASRLCLGTVQFGLAYGLANQKGRMPLADAGEILRLAHSANIGFLDTAMIVHTPEIIDGYIAALDPIFGLIRECEDGRDVMSLLKGPLCHQGFRRLN